MTEMPPMKPSAEDRASFVAGRFYPNRQSQHFIALRDRIGDTIEDAHRDGFAAGVQAERQATDRDQINFDEGRRFERAAIIAMLRETTNNDFLDFGVERPVVPVDDGRAILRALADHLSQTDN